MASTNARGRLLAGRRAPTAAPAEQTASDAEAAARQVALKRYQAAQHNADHKMYVAIQRASEAAHEAYVLARDAYRFGLIGDQEFVMAKRANEAYTAAWHAARERAYPGR